MKNWLKKPLKNTKHMPLLVCTAIGFLCLAIAAVMNVHPEYRETVMYGRHMLANGTPDDAALAMQTWLYGIIASPLDELSHHTLYLVLSLVQMPLATAFAASLFYEPGNGRFWPGLAAALACFACGSVDLIYAGPKAAAFIILLIAWNAIRNGNRKEIPALFFFSLFLSNIWTPAALSLFSLANYGVTDTKGRIRRCAAIAVPMMLSPGGIYALLNPELVTGAVLENGSIPLLSFSFLIIVVTTAITVYESIRHTGTQREISMAIAIILVIVFPDAAFFIAALMLPTVITLFQAIKAPNITGSMKNDVKALAIGLTVVSIIAGVSTTVYMGTNHSIGTTMSISGYEGNASVGTLPAVEGLENYVARFVAPALDQNDASWLGYHGIDVVPVSASENPEEFLERTGATAVILRSTVEAPALAGYLDGSPYWTRLEYPDRIVWNQIK